MSHAETPYSELANLFHRYVEAVDGGDFDTVAELFTHCTLFDPYGNQLAKGANEVLEMYSGLVKVYPDDNTPHTQHIVSNLITDKPSSNTVSARANYTVLQKLANQKIDVIMCGQYRNKFENINGDWRFLEHHMHPKLVGDMSEHLLISLA